MPRPCNGKGFTLIEMILGLMIFSIIAVGLYGVLGGAIGTDKRVKGVHQRAGDMRFAFDLMARDLENAVAYPFVKGKSDRLGFEGTLQRAAFFLPTDEGIVLVEYYAGDIDLSSRSETKVRRVRNVREIYAHDEGARKRQCLVRRQTPMASLLGGVEEGIRVQALTVDLSVDGLRWRYGVMAKDPAGVMQVKFQDEWKDNRLPDVIEVELKFDADVQGQVERLRRLIYPVVKGPVI